MKYLGLVLLLSSLALAQGSPEVSRGGALKKRAYQTYAALTLYVDPTGSDSNPCTASGTAACLTLSGALGKLPRNLRHNVTVNLAAGAYATTLSFSGFNIDSGITLTIEGTMSAFTVATGANTGTVTSESATSTTSPAVITDSGQSWTTNDLRGAFITFASGSQAGLSYPIISNTATSVTVMLSAGASAGVGVAYTIVKPGSTFISSSQSLIQSINGNGSLQINHVWVERSAAGNVLQLGASSVTGGGNTGVLVNLDESLVRTTFGSTGVFSNSSAFSTRRSAYDTGGACVNLQGSLGRNFVFGSITNSFLNTTGTIGSAFFLTSSAIGTAAQSYFRSAGTTNPVITLNGLTFTQWPTIFVECTNSSGSVGVGTVALSTSNFGYALAVGNNGALWVSGCGTGIRANAKGVTLGFTSLTFTNVTTAASVTTGGTINFFGTTPTFTTVTNELQLDGENYTFSFLTGLATPQVLTNSYGSSFIR